MVAVVAITLAILVGAKGLYLIEHWLLPNDPQLPRVQSDLHMVVRDGFRIPGGILLATLALPLVCRWLSLPLLRFSDAIVPSLGLAIAAIRTGCLLNGCCFGRVTGSPLAIVFPPGAQVYDWQVGQGLIWPLAAHTLPVHPLQLYFAGAGLCLYVFGLRWQHRPHIDGEVWAKCVVLFFASTALLEFLRPSPLHLNVGLTASAAIAAAWSLTRLRREAAGRA